METVTCDNCGGENRANAKFCAHCGSGLNRSGPSPRPASDSRPPGTVLMETTAWDEKPAPSDPYSSPPPPSHSSAPPPSYSPPVYSPPAYSPPTYEDSRSPNPAPPMAPASSDRPGCVTVYAVLLIIGALAIVGLGFTIGEPVFLAIFGVLAVANIIIAVGLFQQRNWARVGVIVLMALSILSQLYTAFQGLSSGSSMVVLQSVVGIVLPIFILSWFYRNKQHFH